MSRGAVVAGLFFALGFTAAAASGSDNAAFVSYTGVPTTMKPGEKKTVTVTMRNSGTTTWKTTVQSRVSQGVLRVTKTSYELRPAGNGWGVRAVEVSGSVAPSARRSFEFTITAPSAPGTYPFQWRMATAITVDEVPLIPALGDEGFGATTPRKLIRVANTPAPPPPPPPAPDTTPSFGTKTIPDQHWMPGKTITPLDFPTATGGNGALSYTFSGCYLPRGITRTGRRLSGAPRTIWGPVTCKWTVADSDSNTAASDTDELTFMLRSRRPGLRLSTASLAVGETENGSFTVKLVAKPTGRVTVSVTSGDTTSVVVSPGSLTLDASDYLSGKTITVTAKDDPDAHSESVTVNLSASNGSYDGVSGSVTVNVTDDDTYGSPILRLVEAPKEGGTGELKVSLPTQPTGSATVTLSVADLGALTLARQSLTFKQSNYGTEQSVGLNGVQDDDASNESPTVKAEANGGGYSGQSSSLEVPVKDDDDPELAVSSPSLRVNEGETGEFWVKLETEPTGTVTVFVSSGDSGAATPDPARLSFGTGDWSSWKKVTVEGEQDDDATDEDTSMSLTASGGDYGGESASVAVAVTDDDEPELAVSPPGLRVNEGETGEFWVKLETEPTRPVTVFVSSGDSGAATPDPSRLSFGTGDWSSWQKVAVEGEQDDDATDEDTSMNLVASGGDYGGESASVTVKVDDDDTPALMVAPSRLDLVEGAAGKTFAVKLATEPTATVTVSLTSEDSGAATVSVASLTLRRGTTASHRP